MLATKQESVLSQPVHQTATYRCDDTRGCVMQFRPPDDEHICSKHVEAWNILIVKQKFCASSWLITEINTNELFTYCKRYVYSELVVMLCCQFVYWKGLYVV